MAKTRTKKAKGDPKFIQCPKCGGPIDYFNTCRNCGRGYTPELSESEKLELEEERQAAAERGEEPELDTISGLAAAANILGEEPKKVGTPRYSRLPKTYKDWQIIDSDSDTEISRKRSLMRLDNRKVYNAMGLAVRAHENQRMVLITLSRLYEFLDDDERAKFSVSAEKLKQAMADLTKLRVEKIAAAAEMERAMAEEYQAARHARLSRLVEVPKKKRKKAGKFSGVVMPGLTQVTDPGADTEGFETAPQIALDPETLMQQVKERLALRDKEVQKKEELEDGDSEE
jgi:hypothetical protein